MSAPVIPALRRFSLSASINRLAAAGGATVGGIILLVMLLTLAPRHLSGGILTVIFTVSLTTGLIMFLIYLVMFHRQRRNFDRRMGFTTTGADRIALETWFRHGIKPTGKRLQPALQPYYDYTREIVSGKSFPFGKPYGYFFIGIGAFNVLLRTVDYAAGDGSLFGLIYWMVLFAFITWAAWPSRSEKPNYFFKTFGKRNQQRLAVMRRQLDED